MSRFADRSKKTDMLRFKIFTTFNARFHGGSNLQTLNFATNPIKEGKATFLNF
jgi:hypothetical protein